MMDSPLPPSKRRVTKKSTLKVREFLAQIKEDVKPVFVDIYNHKKFKKIDDIKQVPSSGDENTATLIYLATHLLVPVHVKIVGINLRIIPISINLTDESFSFAEEERTVDAGRIALYFIYEEEDEGGNKKGLNFSTCLVKHLKINAKEEKKQIPSPIKLGEIRHRSIEF